MRTVALAVVGLALLSAPAFAQAGPCRDRVDALKRELAWTRQQLQITQEQLRRAQQPPPSYRPYGGSGYGQGPLGHANRTVQELEQLRRTLEQFGR